MPYDSSNWKWGAGYCTLHKGQGLPCQVCIETQAPGLSGSADPEPSADTRENWEAGVLAVVSRPDNPLLKDIEPHAEMCNLHEAVEAPSPTMVSGSKTIDELVGSLGESREWVMANVIRYELIAGDVNGVELTIPERERLLSKSMTGVCPLEFDTANPIDLTGPLYCPSCRNTKLQGVPDRARLRYACGVCFTTLVPVPPRSDRVPDLISQYGAVRREDIDKATETLRTTLNANQKRLLDEVYGRPIPKPEPGTGKMGSVKLTCVKPTEAEIAAHQSRLTPEERAYDALYAQGRQPYSSFAPIQGSNKFIEIPFRPTMASFKTAAGVPVDVPTSPADLHQGMMIQIAQERKYTFEQWQADQRDLRQEAKNRNFGKLYSDEFLRENAPENRIFNTNDLYMEAASEQPDPLHKWPSVTMEEWADLGVTADMLDKNVREHLLYAAQRRSGMQTLVLAKAAYIMQTGRKIDFGYITDIPGAEKQTIFEMRTMFFGPLAPLYEIKQIATKNVLMRAMPRDPCYQRDLTVRLRAEGIRVPLHIMALNATDFEVIHGCRRLAAAKELGMDTVPCQVVTSSDNAVAAYRGGLVLDEWARLLGKSVSWCDFRHKGARISKKAP